MFGWFGRRPFLVRAPTPWSIRSLIIEAQDTIQFRKKETCTLHKNILFLSYNKSILYYLCLSGDRLSLLLDELLLFEFMELLCLCLINKTKKYMYSQCSIGTKISNIFVCMIPVFWRRWRLSSIWFLLLAGTIIITVTISSLFVLFGRFSFQIWPIFTRFLRTA